ncbi:hypothetical protein [Streptomyces sp. NPDC007100]|uniref:hypothetical protein n=1 Tax=Streptomyces sp. NPDC007100 TaxID=3155602 RepID=UPI0033F1A8A3
MPRLHHTDDPDVVDVYQEAKRLGLLHQQGLVRGRPVVRWCRRRSRAGDRRNTARSVEPSACP